MRPSNRCLLQASRVLQHENPLVSLHLISHILFYILLFNNLTNTHHQGLPKSGTIPRFQRGLPPKRNIKDVRKVIAVSSAKGGVGKSTVAGPSSFLPPYTHSHSYLTHTSKPLPRLRPPRTPLRHPRHGHLRPLDPNPLQPLGRAASLIQSVLSSPFPLFPCSPPPFSSNPSRQNRQPTPPSL
jgi:hypothetical protein